jgi:heptosyltransferase-2
MATPILRAIRRRFADAHLTFLMEPNLRELVRGGDWMNECIEWPSTRGNWFAGTLFRKPYRDLVRELRRRRFDWAVLLPNSFRSALIARLAGAKRRIGYDRDGRGWLLTDRLPVRNRRKGGMGKRNLARGVCSAKDEPSHGQTSLPMPPHRESRGSLESSHGQTSLPVPPGRFVPMPLVEYYADLAEAIGCVRPDDRLELFTTPDCNESVHHRLASLGLADHHPLVVVSPGARYGAAKCWMPERFALVCDRLIDSDGTAVIITCGPGEEAIARRIGAAMQRAGVVFDAPVLTLGEMKSLVSRSDLLLCNDAGPRHFAKAFDVPVVTIFGPTHPEWTATSYEDERICRIDVDCGPCQQRVCPLGHVECMTGVTVEMVYSACEELLGSPVGHSVR